MKKKLVMIVMAVSMLAILGGCGKSASGDASSDASGDIEYDALDYVTLGQYKDLEIEATQYTVEDGDVEDYINNLLESDAYHADTDKTTVEDGDYINLDYAGTIDGESFDGGTATDQELEIGSDTMIDGFEDAIIGATVGQTFDINVTFPDDYSDSDLAGKAAVFTITVNKILENDTTVPEYTDDWVNEYTSGEYTTTTDYDAYTLEYLTEQAQEETESDMQSKLEDAVYANCSVSSLPDGLLDQYFEDYKETDESYAESYGYDFDTYISYYYGYSDEDTYNTELTSYLQTYLEQMLIREAIIETEGWECTDDDIDAFVQQYASYYGYDDVDSFLAQYSFDTVDDFIDYVGEDSVQKAALTLKMWDELESSAKVTYVEESEASADATDTTDTTDTTLDTTAE